MKRLSPIAVCFLAVIILQFTTFPRLVHAAAKVEFFQGEKLPLAHPLANFHLVYNPQIDVIYLNTQKIDISIGGNLIEATYIARQIRKSYLDGQLQDRGEKLIAYLLGEQAKNTHNHLHGLQNKSSDPAKTRAWSERNAESMIPTNNKVASYKIVALKPFQEPLGIDWRSYLPHCSISTSSARDRQ